jgi:hypothetical protein
MIDRRRTATRPPRLALACLLLALGACGQTATGNADAGTPSNTRANVDAQVGAQRTDAGPRPAGGDAQPKAGSASTALPAACSRVNMPGVRVCCGQPGEMPGANCLLPEYVDRPCATEGQTQDIKQNVVCCAGLTPISITGPADAADAGSCVPQNIVDPTRLCTHCGDGHCGIAENTCNCPDDCK